MKFLLGFVRLLGIVVIISAHLVPIIFAVTFFKKDLHWTIRKRQNITRHLVWWLNIRVNLRKTPAIESIGMTPQYESNFLFVSNHRSYLDPIVVSCFVPILPVAKSEVSDWPLIGFGAKITGVLFVKRADKQSRADTRQGVRVALRQGFNILIYPEGTTTDLPETLPFKVGSFATAIEEKKGILPIAIDYPVKSDAWVGKDTFVPHFLRCFGKWRTDVIITFGEPIYDAGAIVLAEKTRDWINQRLTSSLAD